MTHWQRVSFYKDYGPAGHNLINIWSTNGTFGLIPILRNLCKTKRSDLFQSWGTFVKPREVWWFMQDLGMSSKVKEFLKDDQIYFLIFFVQSSLIYQFLCILWDKFNGLIEITHRHHPWNQEDLTWIQKDSWKMTRSAFVNFWATEKYDMSIWMYIARQIQWCCQNYLWTSSLLPGRSWSSSICLIEFTLWLTDKQLVSTRINGQLGIIQSTYVIWSTNGTLGLL